LLIPPGVFIPLSFSSLRDISFFPGCTFSIPPGAFSLGLRTVRLTGTAVQMTVM